MSDDERMMTTLSSYQLRGDVVADDPLSREPAVHVSSTGNSVVLQLRLPRATQTLTRAKSLDSLEIKYRRMKCAVVVMATLMITASILLVGVSLAMAEHIDELGITTLLMILPFHYHIQCTYICLFVIRIYRQSNICTDDHY